MGPCPWTSRGNRYLLVVMGLISRWIEAFSMANSEPQKWRFFLHKKKKKKLNVTILRDIPRKNNKVWVKLAPSFGARWSLTHTWAKFGLWVFAKLWASIGQRWGDFRQTWAKLFIDFCQTYEWLLANLSETLAKVDQKFRLSLAKVYNMFRSSLAEVILTLSYTCPKFGTTKFGKVSRAKFGLRLGQTSSCPETWAKFDPNFIIFTRVVIIKGWLSEVLKFGDVSIQNANIHLS